MKKVLFVMDGLQIGGVETALISVLQHLDYTKYCVDLLLIHEHLDLIDQVPKKVNILHYECMSAPRKTAVFFARYISYKISLLLHLEKQRICLGKKLSWCVHREKYRANIKTKYDAVIGYKHGEPEDFVANCIQSSNKIVFYHHGIIMDKELHQQTFQRVNHIIAVSDGVNEMLRNQYPEYADKISTILNYINPEAIIQKAAEEQASYEQDCLNCITVGRLEEEKRYDLVIESARLLKEQYRIKFRWRIVGDGSKWQELQNRIHACHLDDYVMLMGSMKNPMPCVAASDIYIQTSDAESFGLAMQEAMILGKYVVSTRTIGAKFLLEDTGRGLLVDSAPQSIAVGILEAKEQEIWDVMRYRDLCQTLDADTTNKWEKLLS